LEVLFLLAFSTLATFLANDLFKVALLRRFGVRM